MFTLPRRYLGHHAIAVVLCVALSVALLITGGPGAHSVAAASATATDFGTPENLGVPTESYQVIDTVMGADSAGRPTLYGTAYAALSDQGAVFFGIDPVTGEKRTQKVMEGAYGAYHIAAAPDGRIYIGNQSADYVPRIWQYDPATDQVKVAATINARGFCFGITVSPSGKVYCGVHSGGLYEYDPATGLVRSVSATRAYPKALLMLDDTRMVLGQGTNASVVVLNVITGISREVLPAEYADFGFAYNVTRVGDSVYVQISAPGDRILRFSAGTMEFIEEVPGLTGMSFAPISANEFVALGKADSQSPRSFVRVTDGEELTLTDTGITGSWVSPVRYQPEAGTVEIDGDVWVTGVGNGTGQFGRWNPRTGEVWTRPIDLPGSPADITAMTLGPDGNVYGGTYETQALFGFSPSTGETTNLGVVTQKAQGEILSMAVAEEQLFMASYTDNIITVYDPTKPWNPGTSPDGNPIDLGPAGENQYRPYGMTIGSDGQVWVSSRAAYGQVGGALTSIDPSTHEVESVRYLAGNQHLFSIAAGDGELYVGTDRYGDNSDAGGEAQLLVFDVASREVVHRLTVPGTTRVQALETAPDGTLYGAATVRSQPGRSYWFTFDPETREPIWFGEFPYGDIKDLVRGPDGFIYGLTQNNIFRVDPETAEVVQVATPGGGSTPIGGFYNTLTFDQQGRLYWGSGPNLMRVKVVQRADVSVQVTASPASCAQGGSPITLSVDLRNAGPDDSHSVTVENELVLPDGARIDDVEVPDGTSFDRETQRWTVGEMAPGETLELAFVIESERRTRGDATLSSVVSASTTDGDETNNSDATSVTIHPGCPGHPGRP
jgi:streptogramin lyase